MKSEVKYLINPRIKEINYIKDIKEYVEKVHYYKPSEFVPGRFHGNDCSYIKDEYFWGHEPPVEHAKEKEITPLLFDTEEEAIVKVKLILDEMILEYNKIINNFRKMIVWIKPVKSKKLK